MAEIQEIRQVINDAVSPLGTSIDELKTQVQAVNATATVTMNTVVGNTSDIGHLQDQRKEDKADSEKEHTLIHKRITENKKDHDSFKRWAYLFIITVAGSIIGIFITIFLK